MEVQRRKQIIILLIAFLTCIGLFTNLQTPLVKGYTVTATKTYVALSEDGWVHNEDTSYSAARTASSAITEYYNSSTFRIGQKKIASDYYIDRTFIYFDVNSIPSGATITTAILSLYVTTDTSTQDFNVTIQHGTIIHPKEPFELSDFYYTFYNGNHGSKNSSTITGAGRWNITLTSDGLGYISTGSHHTRFCLRSYRDINANAPTGNEYVDFGSADAVSSYQPRLYVTYQTTGVRYVVHGPYYESGAVYPNVVNLTLFRTSESPIYYTLNGAGGADTYTIDVETVPSHFAWNISEPGLNYTRVYFLRGDLDYEEIWVYIPNPDEPYYTFTFDITDMVGVSNAYLETKINVAGSNRIVERQGMNVVNQIPFVMTLAHRYTIRLICDQGTYIFGDFIPNYSELTHNLIITRSMFPESYPYLNVTVSAARKNSTLIQANYTDSESLTAWVKVDIKYRKAWTTNYTTAYTTNNTGNNHPINWNSATATVDYKVDFTASRNGTLYTWTFPCPKMLNATNIWDGFWESILGTMPFSGTQLIGSIAIMCCLGMFTYAYTDIGLIITFLLAGFLILIQWYTFSAEMWIFGFCMVVLNALMERKKQEAAYG